MGQTLSEPVTEKETAHCHNDEYSVGSSCMQGYRIHMEDSHTHILSLPDDPGTAFFAVYDGHGGANIGKYASKHLHKFIVKRPEYQTDVTNALKKAFLDIDEALLNEEELKDEMGGSTAVCCLIKENKLYCANAGDSRAIACVNGQAVALSLDHKPVLPVEMQRIHESGGWVENSRVNGSLALSRALGDFKFKQNKKVKAERQIVTAYPDVEIHPINEDWEFVLLASDGIWDVMTNDDVVRLCLRRIEMGIPPEQICEELMTECLSPDLLMAGTDNMTVVLICFLHKKSYEELSKRAKDINERERRKADEMNSAYNQVNSYLKHQTAETTFADLLRNENGDGNPSTSAESSKNVDVRVTNYDEGDNDDDEGEHDDGNKIDSDNENQDDDGKKNGTVDEVSVDSRIETDLINGPVSPKSPRDPSDLTDECEQIQESKKHKENDENVDLK